MTKHVIDRTRDTDAGPSTARYLRAASKGAPRGAAQKLAKMHRRAPERAETDGRVPAYTRIERGFEA